MRIFSKHIFVCSFLIVILIANTFSQLQNASSIGGLPGAPMRMGFGARGIAMGNALTAVISGDLQSYYNPASVTFQSVPTGIAGYGVLSLDRRLNYLSYTKSLKPNAGLSLSIINAGVGNIDGRNRDGIHTETYSTSENAFMFSFGLKPNSRFAFGVTAKVYYYSLFEKLKSTTMALDFGAILILSQEITAGFVIQDVNAKYKWDTTPLYGINGNSTVDKFPLRKRFGLSWTPSEYSFIISSEFESIGSASFFRIGSEINVYDGVSIRGGIDQIALDVDMPAKPALGLSFQTNLENWAPSFQYTYVFEPYSPGGIHILSLSVRLK